MNHKRHLLSKRSSSGDRNREWAVLGLSVLGISLLVYQNLRSDDVACADEKGYPTSPGIDESLALISLAGNVLASSGLKKPKPGLGSVLRAGKSLFDIAGAIHRLTSSEQRCRTAAMLSLATEVGIASLLLPDAVTAVGLTRHNT